MSNTILASLRDPIEWAYQESDPDQYLIQGQENITLLNPVIARKLEKNKTPDDTNNSFDAVIFENKYIFSTKCIAFKTTMDIKESFHKILELSTKILSALRIESQLVHLSLYPMSLVEMAIDPIPIIGSPITKENSTGLIRRNIIETAITSKNIVDSLSRLCEPSNASLAKQLLLDAIQALETNYFKKAIIYSAIAIESSAATDLDDTYASAIENPESFKHLRIVLTDTKEGKKLRDPIFEKLSKGTSDFRALLHERYLYMKRRSLLIENQSLYEKAVRVYQTRNKIVHFGDVPSTSNDLLEVTENGAKSAIECALEVLTWIGLGSIVKFPSPDFIMFVPAEFID